jgi:hypothetical protein
MVWYVAAYEKSGDEWMVKYIPTHGIAEDFIRQVWSLPDDDTVVGACYRITPVEVARMQECVAEAIDLDAYTYELCDEDDGHGEGGQQSERTGQPPGEGYHVPPTLSELRATFGEGLQKVPGKTSIRGGPALRPRWIDAG